MNINPKDIDNIEWDGIDTRDYPDFCDAFICCCDINGKPSTDEQLDWINDNLIDYFHDQIYEYII